MGVTLRKTVFMPHIAKNNLAKTMLYDDAERSLRSIPEVAYEPQILQKRNFLSKDRATQGGVQFRRTIYRRYIVTIHDKMGCPLPSNQCGAYSDARTV
jgi:hypothetical protein